MHICSLLSEMKKMRHAEAIQAPSEQDVDVWRIGEAMGWRGVRVEGLEVGVLVYW